MGGRTHRAIFGGENVLQSASSKTSFRGHSTWDWSGLCPFLPGRGQTGVGERTIEGGGGGPKPFLGRGVYCCVFPTLEFSIPLCRSLIHMKK